MATAEERVVEKIKEHLKSEDWQKKLKRNAHFANFLENLKATDVSFGPQPKYIWGNVHGTSTGVGTSTFGDTETQRTVSISFTTGKKLFISDSNQASYETCMQGVARFNYGTRMVYKKTEGSILAEKEGKTLCDRDLYDLNFTPKEHYLKRWHIENLGSPFTCPLWPIFLNYVAPNGKSKQIHFGYWEDHDGRATIDLQVSSPLTSKQKWIIAGVVAGVIGVIALLIIL